jgi:hypothetical protein
MAWASEHLVVAEPSVEHVVAESADQPVVAAGDQVVAAPAEQLILPGIAGHVVGAGTGTNHVLAAAAAGCCADMMSPWSCC